jgi:hypothetical protein
MMRLVFQSCICLALGGCASATHTPAEDASAQPIEAGMASDAARPDASRPAQDAGLRDAAVSACDESSRRDLMVLETNGAQASRLSSASASPTEAASWELEGTVIAQGRGFPSIDIPAALSVPSRPEEFSYVRVRGERRSWTVVVRRVPGFGVRTGTKLIARFSHAFGGWSPDHATLSLTVDGQVAFFYALSGDVGALSRPEGWQVQQVDALCETKEACGVWSSYALALDAPDGTHTRIAPDQQASLAGYTVLGGSDQQLPSSGSTPCNDWYVSSSELVFVRDAPLGPSQLPCKGQSRSTLPGVEIRFPDNAVCTFSLAQARAGVRIPYQIVVAQAVAGLRSHALDAGGCAIRPAGELSMLEELTGNGQHYGVTDIGGCGGRGQPGPLGTLRSGTSEHALPWDGVNWWGPSDTSQAKGAAFPPGLYTFTARAEGTYDANATDADAGEPFMLEGSTDILLTE